MQQTLLRGLKTSSCATSPESETQARLGRHSRPRHRCRPENPAAPGTQPQLQQPVLPQRGQAPAAGPAPAIAAVDPNTRPLLQSLASAFANKAAFLEPCSASNQQVRAELADYIKGKAEYADAALALYDDHFDQLMKLKQSTPTPDLCNKPCYLEVMLKQHTDQIEAAKRRLNPTQPAPSQPAVQVSASSTPTASPVSPVPPSASTQGNGIAGCWSYNNLALRMDLDGRVTGFVQPGKWHHEGGNRYSISWAAVADTVQLSPNGQSLTGTNNFGPPISASRASVSAGTNSFVGSWRWSNGGTAVISEGGAAQAGALTGRWAPQGGTSYRIDWNFVLQDQLNLSTDEQTLSGNNNFGVPIAGARKACPN
jgi:hypothetical protein